MITPLGKNIILKKKITKSEIIYVPSEDNNLYVVLKQGNKVEVSLENKVVFVKDGLTLLEYNNEEYYITTEDNILVVVEE